MKTKKICINSCYGGFGLSHGAILKYAELKGITLYPEQEYGFWHYYKVPKVKYDEAVQKSLDSCGNYKEVNGMDLYFIDRDIERDDPILIQLVEEMGGKANGSHAKLKIVEIPADVNWEIDEYDGWESVDEVHRSWN